MLMQVPQILTFRIQPQDCRIRNLVLLSGANYTLHQTVQVLFQLVLPEKTGQKVYAFSGKEVQQSNVSNLMWELQPVKSGMMEESLRHLQMNGCTWHSQYRKQNVSFILMVLL